MDDSELDSLDLMLIVARLHETTALTLLDMAWTADGVSDAEANLITALSAISRSNQATAESVLALAWIADGVSDAESKFLIGMTFIAESSGAVVAGVLALPWVADGVSSDTESGAAIGLGYIASKDADAAARVADMPFLQTLEDADAAALYSLSSLTADQFADALSRPMLEDGITDDEAPIVSMLFDALEEADRKSVV